jgi:DNA-binding NarL/FixJ family response regulator
MTEHRLRILHLESNAGDAALVAQALERAGLEALVERVDCEAAFRRAVREFGPDVVLGENGIADFTAVAAVEELQGLRSTTPLIVVAGALDAVSAVACFKAGAEDLVLKSDLTRLGATIAAALAVRRPLERLSPRQLEVLRLMAEGASTRTIARRLALSPKTVEAHRSEVMRRLGIRDVASLARYAVRVGLVPLRPAATE